MIGWFQNFSAPAGARLSKSRQAILWAVGLILLFLLMDDFVLHSVWLGLWGLTNNLDGVSPFFDVTMPLVTFVMFFHMITGGAMLVLAAMQMVAPLRRRVPKVHRWGGRMMVGLGVLTASGGLVYAIGHGTTGGTYMDYSSSLYGLMMLVAAVQTLRTGMKRRWADHRRWGMRLSVLALASWFYRLHYVIWYALFDHLWVTDDMRGPFDVFQAWGFYLGYAALLELWFLWEARKLRLRRLTRDQARDQIPA